MDLMKKKRRSKLIVIKIDLSSLSYGFGIRAWGEVDMDPVPIDIVLSNSIQFYSGKCFYIVTKTPLNLVCSSNALQLFIRKAQTSTRTTSYLSILEIVFIFGLVAELMEKSADWIRQKNVNFLKQTNAREKAEKKMLFTLRIRPNRCTHTHTYIGTHWPDFAYQCNAIFVVAKAAA